MKKLASTLLVSSLLLSAGMAMAASSNPFAESWNATKKSYTDAIKETHEQNKANFKAQQEAQAAKNKAAQETRQAEYAKKQAELQKQIEDTKNAQAKAQAELEKKQAEQKAAYEAERKARIEAQKKQQQEALTKFQNKLYGN